MLSQFFMSADDARERSVLNREIRMESEHSKIDNELKDAEAIMWKQIDGAIRAGDTNYCMRVSVTNTEGRNFMRIFDSYLAPAMRDMGYKVRSDMILWPETIIDISWEQ